MCNIVSPDPVWSRAGVVALAGHCEAYGRGVLGVVEHLLVGWNELRRGRQRLPASGVPRVARVRTAGDLQPQPVVPLEAVSRRPQIYPQPQRPVGLGTGM